jgi:TRAP-type mannitol/chloroaromatic compound transport system permease small subunit
MHALKSFFSIIDKINEWIAKFISWSIIIVIASTGYEVIMRYVFASPTEWSFELNYLLNGAYFMLWGAYTFASKGHVNVDIIYGRLSSRKQAIVDMLTAPFFFFFTLMLLIYGTKFALKSFAFRETLSSAWGPPIYPVKMIIPIAAAMLLLQGLSKFIDDCYTAFTGRKDKQ